jgi:hypothetical protein
MPVGIDHRGTIQCRLAGRCCWSSRITASKSPSKRISQRGLRDESRERLAHGAVQPEFVREQHHPRIGTPPQDGLAAR